MSLSTMTTSQLERADWAVVQTVLDEAHRRIEHLTGGRHTWMDGARAIAAARSNPHAAAAPDVPR